MVAEKLNISYKEAMHKINRDMNLGLGGVSDNSGYKEIKIPKSKPKKIQVITKP